MKRFYEPINTQIYPFIGFSFVDQIEEKITQEIPEELQETDSLELIDNPKIKEYHNLGYIEGDEIPPEEIQIRYKIVEGFLILKSVPEIQDTLDQLDLPFLYRSTSITRFNHKEYTFFAKAVSEKDVKLAKVNEGKYQVIAANGTILKYSKEEVEELLIAKYQAEREKELINIRFAQDEYLRKHFHIILRPDFLGDQPISGKVSVLISSKLSVIIESTTLKLSKVEGANSYEANGLHANSKHTLKIKWEDVEIEEEIIIPTE